MNEELEKNILSGIVEIVTANKLHEAKDRHDLIALIASGALILIDSVSRNPERYELLIETAMDFDPESSEDYTTAADQMAKAIEQLTQACVNMSQDPWMPTEEVNDGFHFLVSHITKDATRIHAFVNPDGLGDT